MIPRKWVRLGWLLNRRVSLALFWVVMVVGIAVAVNVTGIQAVGSIDGWERWLQARAGYFFGWRLLLYAATAHGWWRMRRRLLAREPGWETGKRLLRIEIAAVATIVLLEGGQLLRSG